MKKRILTPEQIAARDEKRARFHEIAKQVAALSEEQRAAMVNTIGAVVTCEGRALSVHNTCILIMQTGGRVSMVGGFQQWIKAGRCVRKGERGLSIWIPTHTRNTAATANDALPSAEPTADAAENSTRFVVGTVFDISQTDALANTETAAA